MKKIDYRDYHDKVFGCWLGKSISGTIGAPSEGRKELFGYSYDPRSIINMLPNDDLDLQVLWLEVIENKGIYFKTEDLADAFMKKCPYSPGEYQVFKKNYARGIRPPYSGTFNNSYYLSGMGCPIRSEIWACIAPGNPILAAEYAWKDGVMDHGLESVYAEAFLAGMESAAFFDQDLNRLIDTGLSLIPPDSKFCRLVSDVRSWYGRGYDFRYTRELIIKNYGHPDCTNMFENMGIAILALLYGKGEFIDTTMLALNCGFDTDCTCATAGALLGIVSGAKNLMEEHAFKDTTYKLSVDCVRRSNLLYDLAVDTCHAGLTVAEEINRQVEILNPPRMMPIPSTKPYEAVEISVDYIDKPSVGIGESVDVMIHLKNNLGRRISGQIDIDLPCGWIFNSFENRVYLEAGQTSKLFMSIHVPSGIEILYDRNILTLNVLENGDRLAVYSFGIAGAAVWKCYGPFWQNNLVFPKMDYWESYYGRIELKDTDKSGDMIRKYHLNTVVDLDREYLSEPELGKPSDASYDSPYFDGWMVNTYTDRFSMNDLVGFAGPCVLYLERLLYSPEFRDTGIQVGHTDAYKLWVNNKLLGNESEPDWCTNENQHFEGVKLIKGMNRIVVKLVRRSEKADFCLIFSDGGASMCAQFVDFASMNPI